MREGINMSGGDFVVDNSVVMTWCISDEENDYSLRVLSMLEKSRAYVPSVWPLEVGNVLVCAERRGRISRSDSSYILELLSGLPITIEQESPGRILSEIFLLARDCGISTYDASYLDLAMKMSLPVATLDEKLKKAAKSCKVRLV
jgi:predicted nucleic acid-binding protein